MKSIKFGRTFIVLLILMLNLLIVALAINNDAKHNTEASTVKRNTLYLDSCIINISNRIDSLNFIISTEIDSLKQSSKSNECQIRTLYESLENYKAEQVRTNKDIINKLNKMQ